MALYKGYPAYSSDEIERIQKEQGGPDVMLVGMNPSFSSSIFTQLRKNNQEQFDEFFIDLRRELLINSDDLRKDEIAGALTDDQLRRLFQKGSPDNNDDLPKKRKKALHELQYFFLNGKKKEGVLEWMKIGAEEKSINYFDSIRKVLRPLGNKTTWYHEDLVDKRETDQEDLIRTLDEKSWEKHIKHCWKRIDLVKPKVLLIANSKVAEKLFSNWVNIHNSIPGATPNSTKKQYPSQRELKWQGQPNFRLCVDDPDDQQLSDSWHGPVVFSRQLSGGCSKAMIHYCLRDLYGSIRGASERK